MAILVNLGVLFSFLRLKRRLRALKIVKSKDSAKKMTAVFQLIRKTHLLESFINVVLDPNFVHCSQISLWTVKMKDRKCRRLQNARVHNKQIIWQMDFLGFGACGSYIVFFGTSTLLAHL